MKLDNTPRCSCTINVLCKDMVDLIKLGRRASYAHKFATVDLVAMICHAHRNSGLRSFGNVCHMNRLVHFQQDLDHLTNTQSAYSGRNLRGDPIFLRRVIESVNYS